MQQMIPPVESSIGRSADSLFHQNLQVVFRRTDRLFAGLLVFQWLAGIATALWISPLAWAGPNSETHLHVWAAVFLGGAIISLPVLLALFLPGRTVTRHLIGVAQMLLGALLIHLSGGRIETHFHVFGSLAFLAFYRDWRVLVSASAVVGLDHLLRGIFWPQSVFGVVSASSWRWLEHAGWVAFEDVFLIRSCLQGMAEMRGIALREAQLEATQAQIESTVRQRTAELTERTESLRHMTEQLGERETRIRTILDTAGEGIISVKEDGIIESFNAAAERLFGRTVADTIGHNVRVLFPASYLPDDDAALRQFLRTDVAKILGRRRESTCRRQDGTTFPSDLTVNEVNLQGTRRFIGIVRDITERKQQEASLRDISARLTAILDAATQVSIIATGPTGLITVFNPGAERLLGYQEAEVVGKTTPALFHLESEVLRHGEALAEEFGHPVEGFNIFVERARQGGYDEREWTYVRKDGGLILVDLAVTAVRDGEGAMTGYLCVATNITDRKQAEEQLRKARQAAEAASRAKSEFLANMSHEIRTPMNGIMGMADLALNTELTAEQREYLTAIEQSADVLLTIINDILDFSKIEAGKLDLELIDFDLHELIGRSMQSLAVRAHEKSLELAYHLEPKIPSNLVGDPVRLRQILVNLVGNALKFTQHGEIVVRAYLLSRTVDDAEVLFSVSDTGIGIPLEKQQQIFAAFAQADGSTTRKYGGTGLGLSISSRLAALMGGRIWVESEVGKGSCFHLAVRFGIPRELETSGASARPLKLKDRRVLVVDDNATNRQILREMLLMWGMRPTLVDAGAAALNALRDAVDMGDPLGLVLVDVMMPEMDGLTLVEQIRQQPDLAGVPIILLTSALRNGDGCRARELGVSAYLAKPILQAELLHAIAKALRLSSYDCKPTARRPAEPLRPSAESLHILLAEDNTINQKVAARSLQKQGHRVAIANNGKEALAALERQPFDLVLMDVQMPEMGGFEATAFIRERESGTDQHIPIIALTAHAMKGDRERCLLAGMDEYISKPIETEELCRAIDAVFRRASAEDKVAGQEPVFDRAAAMDRLDGDMGLWEEVVTLFLEQSPQLLEQMRSALATADATGLQRAVHSLKGSASCLNASRTTAAALNLERLAASGELEGAKAALEAFEHEIERLTRALADSVATPA